MSTYNETSENQKSKNNIITHLTKKSIPLSTTVENDVDKDTDKIFEVNQVSGFQTENKSRKLKIKIKKDRDTAFNFTVMSNIRNPRSFGMSEYHSTNSLRNSIQSWTIGKDNRFKNNYKTILTDSIYNIPDNKNLRHTSLGFGNKHNLMPLEGRGVPGPDTYNLKSQIEINLQKKKGALIYTNTQPDRINVESTGPTTYNISRATRLTKGSPIALKSRVMFFYDEDLRKQKHCISPQTYLPSTKSTENLRFTKIGFGIGKKISTPNEFNKDYPGPGTYNLPSVFDKTRKNKPPIN